MDNWLDLRARDLVECTWDNPWVFPHTRKGHLFYIVERSDENLVTYQRCRELKRHPGVLRLSRADWAHGITDVSAFELAYFVIRARDRAKPVPHVITYGERFDQFA